MFAPLDDVLIDRLFQPLSNVFVNRCGLDRPRAACCCLDLASVSWILARAHGLSVAVIAWDAGMSVLRVAMLMVGLLALLGLRMVFRRFGGKSSGNPLRLSMRPHRAIILLMLALRLAQFGSGDPSDAADAGMLLFATLGLYLGACTEPPPFRRIFRDMVSVSAG
ncbi:hypothetical protein [Rhodopila sp.]|uniref:hypothetical protein n=1 Tax=Rhodopila sp. TaxID=2480087 RepID=UPI003D0A68CB